MKKEITDKEFKEIQKIAYNLGKKDMSEVAISIMNNILNRMPVDGFVGYRTQIGDEFRKLISQSSSKANNNVWTCKDCSLIRGRCKKHKVVAANSQSKSKTKTEDKQ